MLVEPSYANLAKLSKPDQIKTELDFTSRH